ncbi:MAG: hypothetical protein HY060_06250 [Proteobacteria bacterium]|nr:hypothetical protein [Pseudomonadota bacterium]
MARVERLARLLLGVAPAALALACAKPPPPTVTLDGDACVSAPALAEARSVPLEDKEVAVTLEAGAPCWRADDGTISVYAMFRLPQSAEPYIVTVLSELRGQSLFAARILLLDDWGKTVRELGHDAFNFRGAATGASLRTRPDERYALVASDPHLVGRHLSQIVPQVRSSGAVLPGGGYVPINTGVEEIRTITFAYSGIVKVSARPLPQEK